MPCLVGNGPAGRHALSSLLGNKNNSQASQPAPPPAPPAGAQPPAAIPLPEVASRAEELTRLLRGIRNQLPTRDQLDSMKAALTERETLLQPKKKEVDALLAGSPSGLELREQDTYWHVISTEGAATRKQLLDWANAAQSAVQQLQALQPQWTATLEENQTTPDLGPTLDVIRGAVNGIETTKAQAQDLLRLIVNLQVSAANQHQLALDAVDRLGNARAQLKDHVLQRDSLPLWRVFLRRQQGETRDFFGNAGARMISIKAFAQENRGPFVALALLLGLSLFGAYRLSVRTRGMQPHDERQAQVLMITRHWFSLGILPPLLTAFLLAPLAPLPLIGLAILLSFFSILVLLPPLIEPPFPATTVLPGGSVCPQRTSGLGRYFRPAAKREVQFFGFLAAIVLFAYLLRPARIADAEKTGHTHSFLIFSSRVALAVLALAQVGNVFGYYQLMLYLTVVCIYSTFIALAVFTALRVFSLLFLAALEAPSAERLAVVRLHRASIARWTPRMLQWAGGFIWLGATLELHGRTNMG